MARCWLLLALPIVRAHYTYVHITFQLVRLLPLCLGGRTVDVVLPAILMSDFLPWRCSPTRWRRVAIHFGSLWRGQWWMVLAEATV